MPKTSATRQRRVGKGVTERVELGVEGRHAFEQGPHVHLCIGDDRGGFPGLVCLASSCATGDGDECVIGGGERASPSAASSAWQVVSSAFTAEK